MRLHQTLCTGAAVIALSAASVAEAGGYYVSVFGGLATFEGEAEIFVSNNTYYANVYPGETYSSTTTHIVSASYSAGWESDFDDGGWVIGVALGREVANGVRAELELAYRGFDVDERVSVDAYGYLYFGRAYHTGYQINSSPTNLTTSVQIDTDGDLSVWSLMANIWYDFSLPNTAIKPFVGGGIGAANLALDYNVRFATTFHAYYSTTLPVSVNTGISESAWAFAYQFGVGIGFNLGNGPMLTTQYRYFGTTDVDIGPAEIGADSHNFLVGITFPLQ